ncbi:hypothetical protein B0H66DRAFT_100888 [Apodospora peruviana]|uniref:Uncharacterized protein n=1 Tax=Apodospora peruviana TaxID=516989 RepID=A0AAE0HSU8_9PEZI|nr:hypothetical protein B0H66DRAFT_100888 [Apodospora peruviana]
MYGGAYAQRVSGVINKEVIIRAGFFVNLIATFLFYVLPLVGCVSDSPGIPNIKIVTMERPGGNPSIGIGAFGMCVTVGPRLVCFDSTFNDVNEIMKILTEENGITDTNGLQELIDLAKKLQLHMSIPTLAVSGVLFFGAVAVWFLVGKRPKSRVTDMIVKAFFAVWGMSFAVALASATSTTLSLKLLDYFQTELGTIDPQIIVRSEHMVEVFQWLCVAFSCFFVGTAVIRQSTTIQQGLNNMSAGGGDPYGKGGYGGGGGYDDYGGGGGSYGGGGGYGGGRGGYDDY